MNAKHTPGPWFAFLLLLLICSHALAADDDMCRPDDNEDGWICQNEETTP